MSSEYGPILRVTRHHFLAGKKVLSTQAILNRRGCDCLKGKSINIGLRNHVHGTIFINV